MAAGNQDVLGLDVAVDHPIPMRVIERLRDLPSVLQGFVDRELPLALEPFAQTLALDERHREPQPPIGLAGIEHAKNVRVLEACGEADFLLEAIEPERLRHVGVQ